MGIEKAGLNLGKEIIAWTRSGKSLLATRPVKVNTAGLKLAPQLEGDTLCITSKINKNAGTVLNTKTNQIDESKKVLEEVKLPNKECLEKEIKQLEEKIEKEEAEFIENYSEPLPSYEERFNALKKNIRIEYGEVFAHHIKDWKELVKDDKNYIASIFYGKPEIKKLMLELNLKTRASYDTESFYCIQKAFKELDKRNLHYDKNSIIFIPDEIIESIAKGKFTSPYGDEVLGHHLAYSINGALRTGGEVDDVLVTILDEGFKNVEPLERGVLVYRQVVGNSVDNSIDFINKLIQSKKGDTFIDKAYSYSTYSKNCATSCNGIRDKGTPWIRMKIAVPKGAKVSNGSHYEQNEMLFPRNAEFRILEEAKIVEETKDGNFMEMLVEYIPKHSC